MGNDLFRDRHPLLFHLREHSRVLGGCALGLIAALWVCWCFWAGSKRIENTFFRDACSMKVGVRSGRK